MKIFSERMESSNWIKNLPYISGVMKYKAQRVDSLLNDIKRLRAQITSIENEIRIELREAEDLACTAWSSDEITKAKTQSLK